MPYRVTRRRFILGILLSGSALASQVVFARTMPKNIPWVAGQANSPQVYTTTFFTEDERRAVAAMSSRLIPTDDTGPGANEANVVEFIDRQLAGFYGRGARWYMRGPFPGGTPEQGYQSEHPPARLYRRGLEELGRYIEAAFDGRAFTELTAEQQDGVLSQMEHGDIELSTVSSKAFFALLLENCIEGFFSDPIYGGNADMVGWRLVGFPGARYDYRDYLGHNGAAVALDPVSLSGRSAWHE